ncbi:HugZ family protein [Roseospira navarrensis]|nr:pyridoxamine 5'-phosphate oxidase family protein [Roseospira navarrensis]
MSEIRASRPLSVRSQAARKLVRRAVRAALCTALPGLGPGSRAVADPDADPLAGAPFGSLVTLATDQTGAPVLLLSRLAEHTRNLTADPRAALLVIDSDTVHANPQEDARVTLLGRIAPDPDPALRRRFLARHPYAEMYAGFADFAMHRMTVTRAHVVGGFGVAGWIEDPETLLVPSDIATALDAAEEAACAHLTRTRAGDLTRIAGPGAWRVVALDADGLDVVPDGPPDSGPALRLAFAQPVASVEDADAALIALVAEDP